MNIKSWRINKIIINKILCFLIAINIAFIFMGCEIEGYEGKHYNITSYADFIKALKDKGYTANEYNHKKDQPSESFFSGNKKDINIGEDLVSVYEFKDYDTAKLEASSISKDGYSIGNKKIGWISTPHFFQKGNLIVSYVGNNKRLYFDLSMILGNSITDEDK